MHSKSLNQIFSRLTDYQQHQSLVRDIAESMAQPIDDVARASGYDMHASMPPDSIGAFLLGEELQLGNYTPAFTEHMKLLREQAISSGQWVSSCGKIPQEDTRLDQYRQRMHDAGENMAKYKISEKSSEFGKSLVRYFNAHSKRSRIDYMSIVEFAERSELSRYTLSKVMSGIICNPTNRTNTN